jgi:hypothetical protein
VKYEVDTESGTRYLIDTDEKLLRRLPMAAEHSGDPAVMSVDLRGDDEAMPFLKAQFEEGQPLVAVCIHNGSPFFRMSTTITAVRQIVQTASDQPA